MEMKQQWTSGTVKSIDGIFMNSSNGQKNGDSEKVNFKQKTMTRIVFYGDVPCLTRILSIVLPFFFILFFTIIASYQSS